ncbi:MULTISPECIES: hypothetical protein [Alphaproteobacteria]|jgi:hypothetical protein|uniref:hypothetical protein n=1 Tax=Alphaproteobacteria TaxID=28211 RepID=UPI00041D5E7A|nr:MULTISPECIES: hypothetical protein [Alphaproteobacteria]MBN8940493.1 hypothetical protein [Hyphomicrobiales bacterium]MDR7257498.1 hypothetical protein [Sphingomonas sp. BE270]OYU86673.1 MAG: hypothetical protein CFE29_28485 [Bradyrhizobiaceae bacterium PARB1]
MSLLTPDVPFGLPAFALSDDQIATVVDLVCRGCDAARSDVTPGMLEVPTTIVVRKAMRRVKKTLGLTNLQVRGEVELEDMATSDPALLGRIDITLQFLHQFGDEDAYVAVECKRVRAGDSALNGSYVAKGVDRFVTSQYATGHDWGFMLGYVLALPAADVVDAIDARIRKTYGEAAGLTPETTHALSLAVLQGALSQSSSHTIRLKHIFVDMLPAAPVSSV